MSDKFLASTEYSTLQIEYPSLFDVEKRKAMVERIGGYESKVAELLPDELYPKDFEILEAVLKHSEYVGRKVIEILRLGVNDITIEKQLGKFYLSEIMRDRSGMRIWRSADTERVFEYKLLDHGDTAIYCTQCDTSSQGYLSFSQSVYPFAISLLAYIQSLDPTGENTLQKWDWQKVFFNERDPRWAGSGKLIPHKKWGMSQRFGDVLYDAIPTDVNNEIHFSLSNGQHCFPVLDKGRKQLSFYVRHPDEGVKIGSLGLFKNDFIIKEADVEDMFLALCQLAARDPDEVLYGIMKYFPEYYQGLV